MCADVMLDSWEEDLENFSEYEVMCCVGVCYVILLEHAKCGGKESGTEEVTGCC